MGEEKTKIECPIIVLVGPTAIGKTALSFKLVDRFDCEIVSMDSMQVYKYMDIGTAKPSPEEQALAPHHLIDITEPDNQYDAARFVSDALQAINEISSRNHAVLLTGGTGLYLKALVDGLFNTLPADMNIRSHLSELLKEKGTDYLHKKLCEIDPDSGKKIHKNDTQRVIRGLEIFMKSGKTWTRHLEEQHNQGQGIEFTKMYQIGLTCERKALYKRIKERTITMLKQGIIDEVSNLLDMGYSRDLPSMQSIGYRHVNNYLSGTWDREVMFEMLVRDTRRYAKRQMTWFGRNSSLHWFERDADNEIIESIACFLQ